MFLRHRVFFSVIFILLSLIFLTVTYTAVQQSKIFQSSAGSGPRQEGENCGDDYHGDGSPYCGPNLSCYKKPDQEVKRCHSVSAFELPPSVAKLQPTAAPATKLSCTPKTRQAQPNQQLTFSASGGTGNYSWIAQGGNPAIQLTGTGNSFTTSFVTIGTKTVQLNDGQSADSCTVYVGVAAPTPQPTNQAGCKKLGEACGAGVGFCCTGDQLQCVLAQGERVCRYSFLYRSALSCSPLEQTIVAGNYASFTASGGSGIYNWSASGAAAGYTSGEGASFRPYFVNRGQFSVTVTSGQSTASCSVTVE